MSVMGILLKRGTGLFCIAGCIAVLLCATESDFGLAAVVGVLLCFYFSYRLVGRKAFPRFPMFLFIASLILYTFLILYFDIPQISDFELQIQCARAFIAGDVTAYHIDYLETWPNLVGYSIIELPILYLTDSVTCIRLFQAVCMSLTIILVFYIMKRIVSVPIAQFASSSLAIYPSFSLAAGATTNQICSSTLVFFAILVFLVAREQTSSRRNYALLCVCGIVLALANFIRADVGVVLIAIVLAVVLWPKIIPKNKKTVPFAKRVASITVLLVSYALVTQSILLFLDSSGIRSPDTDGSSMAANKLLMGTDIKTDGGWSEYYIEENSMKAKIEGISYNEAALDTVLERLRSPEVFVELQIKKIHRLWWEQDLSFALYGVPIEIQTFIKTIDKAALFVLILLCIPIFIALIRCRNTDSDKILLPLFALILTGILIAFVFIEVQPRYLYFTLIVLFVIASYGFEICQQKVKSYFLFHCEKNNS